LAAELAQYKDGTKTDVSRLDTLKQEELIEDIEYLTTENKELHLKVKDVCARNAELKLNIVALQNRTSIAGGKKDISAIMAKNNDFQDQDNSDIKQ